MTTVEFSSEARAPSVFQSPDARKLFARTGWVLLFLANPIIGSAVRVAAPHIAARRYGRACLSSLRVVAMWVLALFALGFVVGTILVLTGYLPATPN